MLNAFLNYLEEHPATRKLADDFTDVLTHLGCIDVEDDCMVASSLASAGR